MTETEKARKLVNKLEKIANDFCKNGCKDCVFDNGETCTCPMSNLKELIYDMDYIVYSAEKETQNA